jgi:ABC-2 type transport system ATP-binding protein
VERLCSHVAIIHRGDLVAQGSIDELRAGVSARRGDGQKLSLEQIFLEIVGGERAAVPELSWLE